MAAGRGFISGDSGPLERGQVRPRASSRAGDQNVTVTSFEQAVVLPASQSR